MAPCVVTGFALDAHRRLRKHRGRVEQRTMMLAAVETVAQADPVGAPRRQNPHVTAQATAGESVHAAPPLERRSVWMTIAGATGTPSRVRDGSSLGPVHLEARLAAQLEIIRRPTAAQYRFRRGRVVNAIDQ